MSRKSTPMVWSACLLALALSAPASRLVAQNGPAVPVSKQANAPSQQQTGGTFLAKGTANSQNLAKAEEEDEEYAFKHSASVRAFARMFHLAPDTASALFWLLNALLLLGLVGYFVLKALPKAFRNRNEQLSRQIVDARKATDEANARLKAVEERLGRLDSEIAGVREQAERDSVNDEQRLRQALEEEKQKIVTAAEQEIAAAGANVERQLRKFAAGLAVDRATARLNLTEGDDRALIQEFAGSLGGRDGKGGLN